MACSSKKSFLEQLSDKNSLKKSQDGYIRVLSIFIFIPKSTTDITQDIMYTMDINILDISFRDFAVGTNEFNKLKNKD